MSKIQILKKSFENVCNSYITLFEKKHSLSFQYWIGDNIGEIATFGDVLIFSFDDIRFDIDTLQPADQILDWCYLQIDLHAEKKQTFNYKSYCIGLR